MKPNIPFALLGALLAVGAADAAVTDPVGYNTTTLAPNQFTLVGLTLQNSAVVAGVLDAESASSVTDTQSDFTALLTAGSTYILELSNGTVQEITSWAGGVLTTPSDITSLVTPGTTTFTLRKAATVSEIFGAANSVGLTPDSDGDFTTGNDLVLIFNGTAFDTVYYYDDGTTTGWFDDGGNAAENKVIAYPDGFFVQRIAGAPINLVVSGTVKTKPTGGVLAGGGFNYLSSVAPAGSTLASSGLSSFITPSTDGDFTTVDNVLIQKPDGSYVTHYYFDDGTTTGWFDDGGNSTDTEPLTGGFLLQNRGVAKPYTIAAPTIAP
jgi:hypothetical protein